MRWNPLMWAGKALLDLVTLLEEPDHGADSAGDFAREKPYPSAYAMSAFSRFPLVYAMVQRRGADLASLPIRLYAGNPDMDPEAEQLTTHDLLDLLEDPSSDTTGVEFRRQLFVDFQLDGNYYAVKVGSDGLTPPVSMMRVHPEDMRIIPNRHGRAVKAYEHDMGDGRKPYAPDLVIHVKNTSWIRGPEGLYGVGMVRALSDDLATKMASRNHQRKLSTQGRPDVTLAPAEGGDMWNEETRKEVLDAWKGMVKKGGPLVLSGAVKPTFLNLKPRDMEYAKLDASIRQGMMAAGQTPPVILGMEVANYATARQQDAVYWRGLKQEAALLDARLTKSLAWLYPRYKGKRLYIRHDFSGVLPLQGERTEQVKRAHMHMEAGATPAEAYAYEGLAGAPVSEEVVELAPAPDPAAPADDDSGADAAEDPVESSDAEVDDDDKADALYMMAMSKSVDRRTVWEAWLVKSHKPAEKRLKATISGYLRAAAQRYSQRLAEAAGGKAMVKAVNLEDVVDEAAERQLMLDAVGPAWRRTWVLAATSTASQLPVDGLEFNPARPEVVRQLQGLVKNATRTQTDAIRVLVELGLAEGASVGAMQEAILKANAFSPARSLTIARTEATVAVSMGTQAAQEEAESRGLDIQKGWLSAVDDATRESHTAMDGQRAEVSGVFTSGDGHQAAHPGGFGVPEEDINCRCAVETHVMSVPEI